MNQLLNLRASPEWRRLMRSTRTESEERQVKRLRLRWHRYLEASNPNVASLVLRHE